MRHKVPVITNKQKKAGISFSVNLISFGDQKWILYFMSPNPPTSYPPTPYPTPLPYPPSPCPHPPYPPTPPSSINIKDTPPYQSFPF